MAEINVEKKSSGGGIPTVVFVALSVVLMAGFFWWLSANAEPTSGPVVIEEPEEDVDAGVMEITLQQLADEPSAFRGQEVRLDSIPVSSRMGSQAFWTQLPNDNPFLVKLDSAALAGGAQIQSGRHVLVVGTLHAMTDSILDAWEAQGALADAMERAEAEFAENFLEARRMDVVSGGEAEQQGGAQQQGAGAAGGQ